MSETHDAKRCALCGCFRHPSGAAARQALTANPLPSQRTQGTIPPEPEAATVTLSDGSLTLDDWRLTELEPDFYGRVFMQIGGWLPEGWEPSDLSTGTNHMFTADLPGSCAHAHNVNVEVHVQKSGTPRWYIKILWLHELRTRTAEKDIPTGTASTSLIVYRAEYEGGSIPLGLYTTPEAAKAHCQDELSSEYAASVTVVWDWLGDDPEDDPDPLDPIELVVQVDGGEEQTTGYVVTPLLVGTAYDPDADT